MKLSIVIPARNESGNIRQTLRALCEHLIAGDLHDFEIVVVNDGSADDTAAQILAEQSRDTRIRLVTNSGRHGFGRAVSLGLDCITGEAAVIYMADASDSPEDLIRYYHILRDEADCAFGSRFISGSQLIDYPAFKLWINRLANWVIQIMFRIPYNDVTNAFKGYRRYVLDGCRPFVSPHFNLTIEIPLKALVRGYSYRVIPISWRNRDIGVSSLRLKEQGSRYLYTLLTVWFEMLLTWDDYKRSPAEHFEPWQEPDTPVSSLADERLQT